MGNLNFSRTPEGDIDIKNILEKGVGRKEEIQKYGSQRFNIVLDLAMDDLRRGKFTKEEYDLIVSRYDDLKSRYEKERKEIPEETKARIEMLKQIMNIEKDETPQNQILEKIESNTTQEEEDLFAKVDKNELVDLFLGDIQKEIKNIEKSNALKLTMETSKYLTQNHPEVVNSIQNILKIEGFYTGKVDKNYGPLTRKAVEGLQEKIQNFYKPGEINDIDGAFGPYTFNAYKRYIEYKTIFTK